MDKITQIKKKFDEIKDHMDNNLDQSLSELETIDPKSLPADLKYEYYYLAGDIHYARDDSDDAIICYNLALKNTYLNNEERARIFGNLASLYFDKELYKDAISYGDEAIRLSKSKDIVSKVLTISGLAYQNLNNLKEAIRQFLEILKIYNESRTDNWSRNLIDNAYSSLAMNYWKNNDDELSEYYCNKVFSLNDADQRALLRAFLCKAHRLYEKRKWKDALEYYNKAISLMDNKEEKQNYQKHINDCKEKL